MCALLTPCSFIAITVNLQLSTFQESKLELLSCPPLYLYTSVRWPPSPDPIPAWLPTSGPQCSLLQSGHRFQVLNESETGHSLLSPQCCQNGWSGTERTANVGRGLGKGPWHAWVGCTVVQPCRNSVSDIGTLPWGWSLPLGRVCPQKWWQDVEELSALHRSTV